MSRAALLKPAASPFAVVPDGLDLFPLRQWVRVSGDAERVFASQPLLDWLARPARYRIVSHGGGAQICAAGAPALAEARAVLQQAYGGLVDFGGVMIHSYVDQDTGSHMAPVMFLRVEAARVHGSALLQLFKEAGAAAPDVDFQKDRAVIRAEILLERLPPLERAIDALSDGAAHTMSWLLGYRAAAGDDPRANKRPT